MSRLRIIVLGTMASDPYAGMAWMHMQIVAGLHRLGHDVYYFETTSTWPYDPQVYMRVDNPDYAGRYLQSVMKDFGLENRWAYRCSYTSKKEWLGYSARDALELLHTADFVLNVSAATRLREEGLKVRRLVYYGTDPVYHEIKYAQGDPITKALVDEHDDVITYGENIGNPDCPIPPLPKLRGKTRQPVLMDMWQSSKGPTKEEFTTVSNYKQAGRDLVFEGDTYYWSKHHEFEKFMDLPKRTNQAIELATNLAKPESIKHGRGTEVGTLGVANDEYSVLEENGWRLTSAPTFTMSPWPYRDYIIASRGEFSFAKDQNIRLRSGWFSERSACYLAAGRPVVTQDTAFDCTLPTGVGLFAFNTMDDILDAFEAINSNYEKHSAAAEEIAREYFAAEKVLQKVIDDLGA